MSWTQDMDELLRKHHKAGLSASISARIIGEAFKRKLSRNAVIGRRNRLGIVGGTPTVRLMSYSEQNKRADFLFKPAPSRSDLPKRVAALKAVAEKMQAVLADEVKTKTQDKDGFEIVGVKLIDLQPHSCRWPIGDPQDPGFVFCGHRKAKGAYCGHHADRAYQGIPKTRATRPMRREAAGSTTAISSLRIPNIPDGLGW